MFKITGNPLALTFPLDRFTLPVGDSEYEALPERVLGRVRNMALVGQLQLVEPGAPAAAPIAEPEVAAATPEPAPETEATTSARARRGGSSPS